jgi:hypothetical protein
MGIFRTKNGTLESLERQLDERRVRRELLAKQLATAEGNLQRETAKRRTVMLEQSLDANGNDRDKLRVVIERARDEADVTRDALSTLDAQISEAEVRLAAERERTAREREAARLRDEMDKARVQLSELRTKFGQVADAMRALDRIPAMLAARENLERVGPQLITGAELGLADGESYAQQMLAEHTPIRAEAPAPPPAPQPPKVERKQIFLRHASRWVENGTTTTAGPHCTVSPPVDIARAALEFNHAVLPDSETARALRAQMDPDYGWWHPDRCCDLTQPQPAPKAPEVHVTTPVQHSGIPGARTGVAVAVPVR